MGCDCKNVQNVNVIGGEPYCGLVTITDQPKQLAADGKCTEVYIQNPNFTNPDRVTSNGDSIYVGSQDMQTIEIVAGQTLLFKCANINLLWLRLMPGATNTSVDVPFLASHKPTE